jgi:hypothetical protein
VSTCLGVGVGLAAAVALAGLLTRFTVIGRLDCQSSPALPFCTSRSRSRTARIAANGRASHVYYDGPFLGHTFRNFELKVDVMVKANANGGPNGGV